MVDLEGLPCDGVPVDLQSRANIGRFGSPNGYIIRAMQEGNLKYEWDPTCSNTNHDLRPISPPQPLHCIPRKDAFRLNMRLCSSRMILSSEHALN